MSDSMARYREALRFVDEGRSEDAIEILRGIVITDRRFEASPFDKQLFL